MNMQRQRAGIFRIPTFHLRGTPVDGAGDYSPRLSEETRVFFCS